METIPGLDGRKMSKSYDNTIPLFLPKAQLRKLLMRIVTDSTPVADPKVPETAAVYQLYRHFVPAPEAEALAVRLRAGGTGWAVAKEALFEAMESALATPRVRYQEWIGNPSGLEAVLRSGAERARGLARLRLDKVRHAVGVS